jgi:WD40 repeat protein
MQARAFAITAVLFALASTTPVIGETQGNPPVVVMPDISNLTDVDRAMFSPDDLLIATLDSGRGVQLWDLSSGRLLRTLAHEAYFTAAMFSADGKRIISAHKDGEIILWDVTTGALTATLQARSEAGGDVDAMSALWIDATGAFVVSGSEAGVVAVWDVAKGKQLHDFRFADAPAGAGSRVLAVRMSSDQARIIAVTEVSIKVFDVKSGKDISTFDLPNKYPMWESKEHNVFSRDSIVSDDGLIVLSTTADCEVETLKFLSLDDTHDLATIDRPGSCAKSEDSSFQGRPTIFASPGQPSVVIARSGIPELKQWEIKTRNTTRTMKWPSETSGEIVGFDRDFRLAVSQKADNIIIREFGTGRLVRELPSSAYPAETAVVSADGRFVLLSHDQSGTGQPKKDVTLWRVDALGPTNVQLAADKDTIVRDFAPGANLALAHNSNGEMILFSTETGREQRRFSIKGVKGVSRARLSPDGKLIGLVGADADDKSVAVLVDAVDGTIKHRFAGRDERGESLASTGRDDESDLVTAMAFSPDSRNVAVGRWNGTAEVWDTQKVRRTRKLPPSRDDADQIWSLSFSNDGKRLIAGSRDSGVFLWDVARERLIDAFLYNGLAGHVHVASVAASHDGRLVAGGLSQHAISSGDTGPEQGIKVWDTATGKLRFTLRGHDEGVGGVTFSSDDRWIISASFDGTIRYWSSANGQWVATCTMARDGRWVVVTEAGFFAGSPGSDDFIKVVRGLKPLPVSEFRDQLYRPDLVELLIKGDREHRYQAARQRLDLEKTWDSKVR